MADALDENWWENEEHAKKQSVASKAKKEKTKKKRKIEESNDIPTTKKRKKKKKMRIEETPIKAVELWNFFQDEFEKYLTKIELDDLQPQKDSWLLQRKDPSQSDLSIYLNEVINDWKVNCSEINSSETHGSPAMLIVTLGGQRAVDLLRATKDFRGVTCKTAKLFAKHLKVKEQCLHLEKNIVHLGVGTPDRIIKLLKNGGLSIAYLRYVILDWTHKDSKERSLRNMHGVKDALLELFREYFFPLCRKDQIGVGLF